MSGLSGRRDVPRGFGVNVIGHVSGNLGLGVIARNVVSVILSRGCPLLILDIDPGLGRGGHDDRFLEYTVGSIDELSYPVTLLVFPPDSARVQITRRVVAPPCRPALPKPSAPPRRRSGCSRRRGLKERFTPTPKCPRPETRSFPPPRVSKTSPAHLDANILRNQAAKRRSK